LYKEKSGNPGWKVLTNFSVPNVGACAVQAWVQERERQKLLDRSARVQGDQIGRIFAYWAIAYFGAALKITEVA
jgi:hypothetical protein